MKTDIKKVYEAMFLIDSVQAASDWDGTEGLIKSILEKAQAEIISLRKWDERKLAYDIGGKSRGTYVLCYFNAPANKISQIERDVRLSEKILRVLILKADHLTKEDMEKETPLMLAARGVTAEQAQQQAAPKPKSADVSEQKIPDIMADLENSEPSAGNSQDKEHLDQPDITI